MVFCGWVGSCHSFGVAWICVAMACAKSVGEILSTVAVRWADMVRILIHSRVSSFYFLISSPTLSKETFNCPRGESELVECHPLFVFSAEPSLCRLGRHCPRCRKGIGANVSICVRAGLPKPRGVPDTERNKDTKTLDYASTPLDANTLLPPCANYASLS